MRVMCELGRYDAIVVGAGLAGLTAAAELAHRNVRTLVLERHNVPGGCASFYQRDGYRFDVGATLIGGFGPRGVHRLLNARLGIVVSPEAIEPAMAVHLPGGSVTRYGDARWQDERIRAFGPRAEAFWREQERIAELAWDFSSRFPALPVDLPSLGAFARAFRPRQLGLVSTLGRTLQSILPRDATRDLRTFVDAQLLITAQTDARAADLAYGATALDLAREGTFHLPDGVSTLAVALARFIRAAGSRIVYNTTVARIEGSARAGVGGVLSSAGARFACDRVIAAVPVQDALAMCPSLAAAYRPRLAALPQRWGAFMLYCGLPPGTVPDDLPVHHQAVAGYESPLGEGNSTFLSFSGAADRRRARAGGRAVTISTHTDVALWERAYRDGRHVALRAEYADRLAASLERIVPGARAAARLLEPADPHTFARYTNRLRGLVGGSPQTPATASLGAITHHTPIRGLYLAGDTTFPGQSTVGATLSGVNAARAAEHRS